MINPKIVVVVFVEGGNVTSIYSSDSGVKVEIIDFDDLATEGMDYCDMDCLFDEKTEGKCEIFSR